MKCKVSRETGRKEAMSAEEMIATGTRKHF